MMDEIRWSQGMDELRAVQELVGQGRFREALDRGHEAIVTGGLGRKRAAQMHSLLCYVYSVGLEQPSPQAVLHGEEAIRLAGLARDQWIEAEAVVRLIPAYCHLGDVLRAREGCELLAVHLERNESMITGGWGTYWLLRALTAMAAADWEKAADGLAMADAVTADWGPVREKISAYRAALRVFEGDSTASPPAKAGETALLEGDGRQGGKVRGMVADALAAEGADPNTARQHARAALCRAIESGRADLARALRRRLAHLL